MGIINMLQELIDDPDVRTVSISLDEDPGKAGPYQVTTTPIAGTRPYAEHTTWAPTLGEAVQVSLRYHQAPRPPMLGADRECKACAPGYGHNNKTYAGPPHAHDGPWVNW